MFWEALWQSAGILYPIIRKMSGYHIVTQKNNNWAAAEVARCRQVMP